VRTRRLGSDKGSVLIEVVAFAVVGFGLVLTLGHQLMEQERKVLELQGIARNSMRAYLLQPTSSLAEHVSRFQDQSKLWAEERIDISVRCLPNTCNVANTVIWLELQALDVDAKSFGVSSG